MSRAAAFWSALLAIAALAPGAEARPDLSSRRLVDSLLVFADDARPDLYYFGPPEPRLARRDDGAPDLSLLFMRYSGAARFGTRGLQLHHSILTVRVVVPEPERERLERLARTLGGARSVELRPLPIRRLESALVYASVGAGADSSAHPVRGGRFEGGDAAGGAGAGVWSERVYTVGLDSLTAQAMGAALERGQLALSLAYAFVADGRAASEPFGDVTGPPELAAELARAFASGAARDSAAADSAGRQVVRAGAIRIGFDPLTAAGAVRRIDVDAQMPAGFAALEVYCFDFRDARRPDLYEKRVEVEATSVSGDPVRREVVFAREHPDVFAAGVRFPVAVRLKEPYRYRVTELRPDGSAAPGPWVPGRSWLDLLDVTTPAPARTGVRPIR